VLSQSTELGSSTIAYKWPDESFVTQPRWQDVFDKSCLLKLKAKSQEHFRRQILLESQSGAGLKIPVGPEKVVNKDVVIVATVKRFANKVTSCSRRVSLSPAD
jgi:hypothetical protein